MKTSRILIVLLAFLQISFWGCEEEEVKAVACFTISNSNPDVGESVSFTNCSEEASSFEWDFGDGQTSLLTSPSHAYSGGGTYTVSLTAKNDNSFNNVTKLVVITEQCCQLSGTTVCESDIEGSGYTWAEYSVQIEAAGGTCD